MKVVKQKSLRILIENNKNKRDIERSIADKSGENSKVQKSLRFFLKLMKIEENQRGPR